MVNQSQIPDKKRAGGGKWKLSITIGKRCQKPNPKAVAFGMRFVVFFIIFVFDYYHVKFKSMTYILIFILLIVVIGYFSNSFTNNSKPNHTIDTKYNTVKREKEAELNKLLEKIHKKGMENLSDKERERLKELS